MAGGAEKGVLTREDFRVAHTHAGGHVTGYVRLD